jgi:hypothetical protein
VYATDPFHDPAFVDEARIADDALGTLSRKASRRRTLILSIRFVKLIRPGR